MSFRLPTPLSICVELFPCADPSSVTFRFNVMAAAPPGWGATGAQLRHFAELVMLYSTQGTKWGILDFNLSLYMQINCCIFSQVNSASIYNNRNLLLGLLNENSPRCLCFPAWAVSFQLFCARSSRMPKRFCGRKEALRKKKNQEWEIIVGITQQDGWMTFCPCFSQAKPLQCLKLSTCLSILLIWSQNTQNCIWLVPPNLLLKQLQNWSAPTLSWAHLVQTQPFPSKETDYTESLETRGWKVKHVDIFCQEQRNWIK